MPRAGASGPLSLREAVLAAARAEEGLVVCASTLPVAAPRRAVSRALARLAMDGALQRIRRGLYVASVPSEFGWLSPPAGRVVRSHARRCARSVVPNPLRVANWLGFTTQNAMREVWMWDGPDQTLRLGGRGVELRCAPRWLLAGGETPVGWAAAVLRWLGGAERPHAARELRAVMDPAAWASIVELATIMPDPVAADVRAADASAVLAPEKVRCRLQAVLGRSAVA